MCSIIYERYLLAKVYFTKFNGCYALKLNNSCLLKYVFYIKALFKYVIKNLLLTLNIANLLLFNFVKVILLNEFI